MVKQVHKAQMELDLSDSKGDLLQVVKSLLSDSSTDIQSSMFNEDFSVEFSKWDSDEESEFKSKAQFLGIDMESVDHYGGEGQGEEYWTVWKFTKGTEEVYFKFQGYYQSYDGATYNEYILVEPKEVLVTQYHEVK